jgi:uncharacterized GH25 family protein
MKSALILIFVGSLLFSPGFALGKKKRESSALNFVVVKETNGKPVRNASVVLHALEDNGRQAKGGYELKTDPEGKTSFEGVPYGKLRVQVLAPGYQTFGDDYEINQPQQEIVIKLKPPRGQYSIYK